LVFFVLLGATSPAQAVSLTLQSETSPYPGIVLKSYKTTSPKTNLWAVFVDLCTARIHVGATKTPTSLKTAASWGTSAGVQVAVNGDFYKTGPVRVYGKAVGDGIEWPLNQQGIDPGYSWEWFYQKFGWIAFGHDSVEFSHSKWVKNNVEGLTAGWQPGEVVTTHPPGTIALVSGFSELVIEGEPFQCSSPTAEDCFPDRSDMRARHPRTAMGITEDRKTVILLVVDGRTSSSIGMYGAELAEVMGKLGAWEAFNLDGGGSSQMWVSGKGTVNNSVGNNNGGSTRKIANHWGIFAGPAGGKNVRPQSCVTEPPCKVVGPGGDTIDDSESCFVTFGPPKYWRKESVGFQGGLRWTNGWKTAQPANWAWWRIHLAEAGEYQVDYYGTPAFSIYNKTHYEVRAKNTSHLLEVNQSGANGWTNLGTWNFTQGGQQWVAVFDDSATSVPSDQHIVADAIRLTRVGPWCGNGACDGGEACATCPTDCGACPICGDGDCNGSDNCASCPGDCGVCPPECGDGECNGEESCSSCTADCGICPPECGDGECNGEESCVSCEADCGICLLECGDGKCSDAETCSTCEVDCGACPCGDGVCADDEDCDNCPGDCWPCDPQCGDGFCDLTESCILCAVDCGQCEVKCGDGLCLEGEDCDNCPEDCWPCSGPPETSPDVLAATDLLVVETTSDYSSVGEVGTIETEPDDDTGSVSGGCGVGAASNGVGALLVLLILLSIGLGTVRKKRKPTVV
jgi:hypothetical protein